MAWISSDEFYTVTVQQYIRNTITSEVNSLETVTKVDSETDEYNSAIHFRTIYVTPWISDEPDLTVPDLEDTIEQMYNRRASGLKTQFNALGQRYYPTDPTSLQSAREFLVDYQRDLKLQTDELQSQYDAEEKSRAALIADEVKAKKEFEEFKKKVDSSKEAK